MKMSPIPYIVLALSALVSGGLLPTPRLDGRIVGGKPTTIEEYPYQLSLEYLNQHSCGASIISENWALTAAHCVSSIWFPNFLKVRAGTTMAGEGGSYHKVETFIVHPLYKGQDYDFALIRVKTPFPIGQPGIQVIEMASVEPQPGETAIISGWGTLWAGGSAPKQLQFVEIPVISRDECKDKYIMYQISDRMICAAVNDGGKDACQGDSGGPMVVGGKLTGVVSWGIGCGEPQHPGVYSNIANQREWILEHTSDLNY